MEKLDVAEKQAVDQLAEQGQLRIQYARDEEQARADLEALREENLDVEERREELKRQIDAKKLEFAKAEARTQTIRKTFDQIIAQEERLQASVMRKITTQNQIEDEIARIRENTRFHSRKSRGSFSAAKS